jgi:hypothetical protein
MALTVSNSNLRLKQWRERKKWVEEPLIKSYLFVRSYKMYIPEAFIVYCKQALRSKGNIILSTLIMNI